MNAEELKYLRALHPEIVKRMGPIRIGDVVYDPDDSPDGSVVSVCGYCDRLDDGELQQWLQTAIRIPLAIDPVNPGRGLWGMIDWSKFFVRVRDNGKLNIQCQDFVVESSPYLALLRTLAAQWNVEVSNASL